MAIQTKSNPLSNYMRQPKIYIRLPSNGKYWGQDSILIPDNEEFPVYSMTAKDELTFKTPDALMNGQAVVDVIQSCIPNIKNAWDCPGTDLDLILVAIRVATYGGKMTLTHQVPETTEIVDHEIDLVAVMDQLMNNFSWVESVIINSDIMCSIRPLSYRDMTYVGLKTFESQKMAQSLNNIEMTDEEKIKIFNQGMSQLTDLTVEMISNSVFEVHTPTEIVNDPEFIHEFIKNADAVIIQKIQDQINKNKTYFGIQPMTVHSNEEQIFAGAPETYQLPITMDNSNFFVQGS
jgi:hypothetical protein